MSSPAAPPRFISSLPSPAALDAVLKSRTDRILLVLDRIVDFFNLQTILRSADSLGIHHVWLVLNETRMKNRIVPLEHFAGADLWLDFRIFSSHDELLSALKADGRTIWATTLSPAAVPLPLPDARDDWMGDSGMAVPAQGTGDDSDNDEEDEGEDNGSDAKDSPLRVPRRLAIVMGREADGVSSRLCAAAAKDVYIPMVGFSESFNVSVATVIVLQRLLALCPRARGNMTRALAASKSSSSSLSAAAKGLAEACKGVRQQWSQRVREIVAAESALVATLRVHGNASKGVDANETAADDAKGVVATATASPAPSAAALAPAPTRRLFTVSNAIVSLLRGRCASQSQQHQGLASTASAGIKGRSMDDDEDGSGAGVDDEAEDAAAAAAAAALTGVAGSSSSSSSSLSVGGAEANGDAEATTGVVAGVSLLSVSTAPYTRLPYAPASLNASVAPPSSRLPRLDFTALAEGRMLADCRSLALSDGVADVAVDDAAVAAGAGVGVGATGAGVGVEGGARAAEDREKTAERLAAAAAAMDGSAPAPVPVRVSGATTRSVAPSAASAAPGTSSSSSGPVGASGASLSTSAPVAALLATGPRARLRLLWGAWVQDTRARWRAVKVGLKVALRRAVAVAEAGAQGDDDAEAHAKARVQAEDDAVAALLPILSPLFPTYDLPEAVPRRPAAAPTPRADSVARWLWGLAVAAAAAVPAGSARTASAWRLCCPAAAAAVLTVTQGQLVALYWLVTAFARGGATALHGLTLGAVAAAGGAGSRAAAEAEAAAAAAAVHKAFLPKARACGWDGLVLGQAIAAGSINKYKQGAAAALSAANAAAAAAAAAAAVNSAAPVSTASTGAMRELLRAQIHSTDAGTLSGAPAGSSCSPVLGDDLVHCYGPRALALPDLTMSLAPDALPQGLVGFERSRLVGVSRAAHAMADAGATYDAAAVVTAGAVAAAAPVRRTPVSLSVRTLLQHGRVAELPSAAAQALVGWMDGSAVGGGALVLVGLGRKEALAIEAEAKAEEQQQHEDQDDELVWEPEWMTRFLDGPLSSLVPADAAVLGDDEKPKGPAPLHVLAAAAGTLPLDAAASSGARTGPFPLPQLPLGPALAAAAAAPPAAGAQQFPSALPFSPEQQQQWQWPVQAPARRAIRLCASASSLASSWTSSGEWARSLTLNASDDSGLTFEQSGWSHTDPTSGSASNCGSRVPPLSYIEWSDPALPSLHLTAFDLAASVRLSRCRAFAQGQTAAARTVTPLVRAAAEAIALVHGAAIKGEWLRALLKPLPSSKGGVGLVQAAAMASAAAATGAGAGKSTSPFADALLCSPSTAGNTSTSGTTSAFDAAQGLAVWARLLFPSAPFPSAAAASSVDGARVLVLSDVPTEAVAAAFAAVFEAISAPASATSVAPVAAATAATILCTSGAATSTAPYSSYFSRQLEVASTMVTAPAHIAKIIRSSLLAGVMRLHGLAHDTQAIEDSPRARADFGAGLAAFFMASAAGLEPFDAGGDAGSERGEDDAVRGMAARVLRSVKVRLTEPSPASPGAGSPVEAVLTCPGCICRYVRSAKLEEVRVLLQSALAAGAVPPVLAPAAFVGQALDPAAAAAVAAASDSKSGNGKITKGNDKGGKPSTVAAPGGEGGSDPFVASCAALALLPRVHERVMSTLDRVHVTDTCECREWSDRLRNKGGAVWVAPAAPTTSLAAQAAVDAVWAAIDATGARTGACVLEAVEASLWTVVAWAGDVGAVRPYLPVNGGAKAY